MDENKVEYLYAIKILYESSVSLRSNFNYKIADIRFFSFFCVIIFYKIPQTRILLNDPPTVIQFNEKNKTFFLKRIKNITTLSPFFFFLL